MEDITELACKEHEFFETPLWAVKEILKKETLQKNFIDPCFGLGVITKEAINKGYNLHKAIDKNRWGYMPFETIIGDFLSLYKTIDFTGCDVIMNPPFSKATEFVLASQKADKILCFQRFSWLESAKRKSFWEANPPSRVYVCGNRATCWRADIPTYARNSGTTTTHAWFVWDKSSTNKTTELHHIWKKKP